MIRIPQVLSVCLFEFKRSLTFGRLMAYLILSLFPPAMVLLISRVSYMTGYKVVIMFLTYVVCVLSLLLWATPNVYSELESRNWLFVTTRPAGRMSILFGKFLAAAISACLVCTVAISLSSLVVILNAGASRGDIIRDMLQFWPIFMAISWIASIEYAAVFSFFGVMFQRRAMVVATVYALANEIIVAIIPALITQFSVRFHIIGISLAWLGWFLPIPEPDVEFKEIWYLTTPVWIHILVLGLIPILFLIASSYVIRNRQYITVDEA